MVAVRRQTYECQAPNRWGRSARTTHANAAAVTVRTTSSLHLTTEPIILPGSLLDIVGWMLIQPQTGRLDPLVAPKTKQCGNGGIIILPLRPFGAPLYVGTLPGKQNLTGRHVRLPIRVPSG